MTDMVFLLRWGDLDSMNEHKEWTASGYSHAVERASEIMLADDSVPYVLVFSEGRYKGCIRRSFAERSTIDIGTNGEESRDG